MIVTKLEASKLLLTEVEKLDPVKVFVENIAKGKGQITITCFGEAWTAYFGSIGSETIEEFFISSDVHYLAGKLSTIDSEVYDLDEIRKEASRKGVECWRDDPWNDYGFMQEMYGADMGEWSDSIPLKPNHKYTYLCRIIKAVQQSFEVVK